MQLTAREIQHFKNVLWGTRFWRWFRWVLAALLAYTAAAHFSGWRPMQRIDWLAAGALYLLVAWPGLCRTYVFHTLHRLVAEDPQARAQLAAAGVKEFQPDVVGERASQEAVLKGKRLAIDAQESIQAEPASRVGVIRARARHEP